MPTQPWDGKWQMWPILVPSFFLTKHHCESPLPSNTFSRLARVDCSRGSYSPMNSASVSRSLSTGRSALSISSRSTMWPFSMDDPNWRIGAVDMMLL